MAEGRTKKKNNFQSNTSVRGSALSKTFLLSLNISHLFQVILNNLIFIILRVREEGYPE